MFKAPTLLPAKTSPTINRHWIYDLKGMKTRPIFYMELGQGECDGGLILQIWYRF